MKNCTQFVSTSIVVVLSSSSSSSLSFYIESVVTQTSSYRTFRHYFGTFQDCYHTLLVATPSAPLPQHLAAMERRPARLEAAPDDPEEQHLTNVERSLRVLKKRQMILLLDCEEMCSNDGGRTEGVWDEMKKGMRNIIWGFSAIESKAALTRMQRKRRRLRAASAATEEDEIYEEHAVFEEIGDGTAAGG